MSKEILFFSSKACGPCRILKQKLDKKITEELNIRMLDTETDTSLFIEHKVMSVPTFIKLVDGVETNRKLGNRTIQELEEL
jgi:hypothetical protein